MSIRNGRLVTCDRCGHKVFLSCTGEGETDGGYTRWNTFEPIPDGWACHTETGNLCPKCDETFSDLVKEFMEECSCQI